MLFDHLVLNLKTFETGGNIRILTQAFETGGANAIVMEQTGLMKLQKNTTVVLWVMVMVFVILGSHKKTMTIIME